MNPLRQRLFRSGIIVAAGLCLTAATWVAFRHGTLSFGPDLPQLGAVPQFSLVTHDGRPLSQADLAGGIWIADFIFTRCGSLCPILSAQMAKLQTELARKGLRSVRLVSFSVDPAHDTPVVLQEYAQRFRADPNRWLFLTGERAALHTLIGQGFHLAVAERAPDVADDSADLITHSDRFVLVDRDLQIRGYYHGTDQDALEQLLRDLQKLNAAS